MSPNVEVIEKWVEALESGEYKQGKGYLNAPRSSTVTNERAYCCLVCCASWRLRLR